MWRVGYPDQYRFLDDEHDEMGAILTEMGQPSGDPGLEALRRGIVRFLTAFKAHRRSEESVMRESRFDEYELHKTHHEHVIGAIETILAYFDRQSLPRHKDEIVRHLSNKLSEESFFDEPLAAFLSGR
ncbi:MAG: hypothetical protein U1F33_14705 [Alphaproteobacteria bacterium]